MRMNGARLKDTKGCWFKDDVEYNTVDTSDGERNRGGLCRKMGGGRDRRVTRVREDVENESTRDKSEFC